jgi:hypothetical protein
MACATTMGEAYEVEILMVSLESSESNLPLLLESTNLVISRKLDRQYIARLVAIESYRVYKLLLYHITLLIWG